MSYGLIVKGLHGVMQIDGKHSAMNLLEKTTVLMSGGRVGTSSTSSTGYWHNLPNTNPGTSIVAVKSSTWVRVGGMNGKVSNRRLINLFQCLDAPRGNITVYQFGEQAFNWYRLTYGLSVRNEVGKEVFNSNWQSMRVHDVVILSPPIPSQYTYTLPNNGREYAIAVGGGSQSVEDAFGVGYFWSYFARQNGNKIEIDYKTDTTYPSSSDYFVMGDFPLTILIIDVTDL